MSHKERRATRPENCPSAWASVTWAIESVIYNKLSQKVHPSMNFVTSISGGTMSCYFSNSISWG